MNFTHITIGSRAFRLDENFSANCDEAARQERIARAAPELLKALDRANSLLAELTFTDWIKGDDHPASVDIRQRIRNTHIKTAAAIAKATGGAA